jgi:peptidoglycan/LPS O-acetylase OafA/YrhL
MLARVRRRFRQRRGWPILACAVVLLGATVAMAHTSMADDHMGEAAAVCVAVLAGGAALAALPALADPVPRQRAPLRLAGPNTSPAVVCAVPHRPRGDPSLLQVFRR